MNFINKINNYLLEQYPLIWNTRLVWVLGVNTIVHLLFFIIGFSSINGLEDLKEQRSLEAFFFDTSNVYYNVLISIFILLIWIIFYLRNNAFKNLYSIKKRMLFQQFCIIFLIFLISITQFYSFKKGLTTKIKSLYSWQEVDTDIKTFNSISLFLIQHQDNYEIDKKKYPNPFPLHVAITNKKLNIDNVDTSKAYIKHKGAFFQFYKIEKNVLNNDKVIGQYYYDEQDFVEDILDRNVINIRQFKDFLFPSLFNYSKELFSSGQDSLAYQNQLKKHQKILENKNDSEIKNQLKAFISLAKKYEVKHNLDVETWFQLVNNKPNYLLSELINTSNPNIDDNFNYMLGEVKINNSRFGTNIPYSKTLYVNLDNTDYFFKNVHNAYFPVSDIELFYFLFVFSIILSILLFVFKTTDMRTLLLSFVASLVVLVLIVWLMSSSRGLFGNNQYKEYFIMLFISVIIILLSIISYVLRWKKIIIAIFWSLVLFAIPTFFFFASISYIKYLKNIYLELHPKNYSYKSNFETWFDIYGFWAIALIWVITIYFYSLFIRRLKARVE
jgi:hypothetical protein